MSLQFSTIVGFFLVSPIIISTSLAITFSEQFLPSTQILQYTKNLDPNFYNLFGTDFKGRDVFSTFIISSKNTYLISLLATFFSSVLGIITGVFLALDKTVLKLLAEIVVEFFEIIPRIFFLLLILATYNINLDLIKSTSTLFEHILIMALVIGLSTIPYLARLVQRYIDKISKQDFVDVLRNSGVKNSKIFLYNIIWKNLFPHIAVQISYIFGLILLINSSLEYVLAIGFGDFGNVNYLTWGKLLADARHSAIFGNNLWIILPPLLGISATILGTNILGDGIHNNFIYHEKFK